MNKIKKLILKLTPNFILGVARDLKKIIRRYQLKKQSDSKLAITKTRLLQELKTIGIKEGDNLLVHCSLSKIGYIEGGAITLINSLIEILGKEGTLLMPSFPAKGRNKTYLEENPFFDIVKTPSQMGIVSEIFRLLPNVKRSFHPTDAVCALGKNADFLTNSHFNQLTPYNEKSPFRKLCDLNGKILMLGTTLNGACTNLHTLEDAVEFKYPIYDERVFEVTMIDNNGKKSIMKTKVHNPIFSAKRNCDELKPLFEHENVIINGKIGQANCMLIDAKKMLEVMINYYNNFGVTMYTPKGEKGNLNYLK